MTLIELIVTMAVVAIIAAIGYPSYVDHVRKMRRSDAKQSLMRLNQEMQRCYSRYRRFDATDCDLVTTIGSDPRVNQTSQEGFYQIRTIDSGGAETLTAESYTLHAVGLGSQTGDDQCAELSLTNASVEAAVDSDDNDATSLCWQ